MGNRFSKRDGSVMSAAICVKCKTSCECVSVGVGISLHQHKFTLIPLRAAILLLLVFSLLNVVQSATQITGTVLDADTKAPLKNAIISLVSTGDLVLTNENGAFTLTKTEVSTIKTSKTAPVAPFTLNRNHLQLNITEPNSPVQLVALNLSGQLVHKTTKILQSGFQSIDLSKFLSTNSTYILQLKINQKNYTTKILPLAVRPSGCPLVSSSSSILPSRSLAVSSPETLVISKYLYTPITTAVTATIYLEKPSTPPPPPGMKTIPGGTFMMGSTGPFHEQDEIPVHQVTVSPFFIDSTEVTQADYKLLMGVEPWVDYKATYAAEYPGAMKKNPVWYMTWNDAVLYCNERSKRDGLDTIYSYKKLSGIFGNNSILDSVEINYNKNGYRLPTEAEWEYAARAGTTTEFYWGDKYDSTAFKYTRFKSSTAIYGPIKVASLIPNQFGLYDIIGNVYEFVNDYLGIYSDSAVINPTGPKSGSRLDGYARAIRGGSWRIDIHNCRVARRFGAIPDKREPVIAMGFRVALPNK